MRAGVGFHEILLVFVGLPDNFSQEVFFFLRRGVSVERGEISHSMGTSFEELFDKLYHKIFSNSSRLYISGRSKSRQSIFEKKLSLLEVKFLTKLVYLMVVFFFIGNMPILV